MAVCREVGAELRDSSADHSVGPRGEGEQALPGGHGHRRGVRRGGTGACMVKGGVHIFQAIRLVNANSSPVRIGF